MTYDVAFYSKTKLIADHPFDSKIAVSIYGELIRDICSGGYAYSIFDLDNDLTIRDLIQDLMEDRELMEYSEHIFFCSEIGKLDECLKNAFIENYEREGSEKWWMKGILKQAGSEYSENVRHFYGVTIKKSN